MEENWDELKGLNEQTKVKVIEIAKQLINEENMHEKSAIAKAIDHARQWARKRNELLQAKTAAVKRSSKSRRTSRANREKNQLVIPHAKGWAVKSASAERVSFVYERLNDAVKKAREIAKRYNSQLIIKDMEGNIRERRKFSS